MIEIFKLRPHKKQAGKGEERLLALDLGLIGRNDIEEADMQD